MVVRNDMDLIEDAVHEDSRGVKPLVVVMADENKMDKIEILFRIIIFESFDVNRMAMEM